MRWVEGLLLNEFVREQLDRPAVLQQLSQIWARMGKRLREANLAHCDLQHGNVLLVTGSQKSSLAVKLIDYDGMFVPALAQQEVGRGRPSELSAPAAAARGHLQRAGSTASHCWWWRRRCRR